MPSTARRFALAFTLTSVLLASCSEFTSPSRDLENARQRWASNGAASYDFTVYLSCFCTPDAGRPVVVVVANGVVQSRKFVDTGAAVTPPFSPAYSTIEGLFDIVADARARNAAQLDVEYDPERGYPKRIGIDYIANAIDDEINYTVLDFHVR